MSYINVNLDSSRLKQDVFKQIADSQGYFQFRFVSQESKIYLKNYVEEKDINIDTAKNVWKNLLIDAISLLKINDSREKIYSDSQKDSQKLIDNFKHIRQTSSYGIEEIDNYFSDFIDFESVLYGIDRHYRDHINHVLQVWAIGIDLLVHNEFKLNDKFLVNKETDFHFEIEENEQKEITISKSELWAMWTVIALCHDLGYPIEKTSQINKQAKKIISHFGNMQFTELDYSFSIFNTFLVEKFLNIISSKVLKETEGEKYHTSIQTKYRDKLSKSLEDYKHGIFSSLLLFKNLTYFLETDYSIKEKSLDVKDAKQFYIRKEILRAIAGHTCPKLYHIDFNRLSFLLILCDELQEWNRPKFNSFVNNYKEEELTVEIKEFDMREPQKVHIIMHYPEIEINKDLEKYLVIWRYKNIHYLLRSAKEDSERKIYFKWDINFKQTSFSFCFDTSSEGKDSFNMLSVKKGNEDLDLYHSDYL
jgi:hypothetical protein